MGFFKISHGEKKGPITHKNLNVYFNPFTHFVSNKLYFKNAFKSKFTTI